MQKQKNKEDFLEKKKQPHLKKDSSERKKGRKKKEDSGEDESFKVEVDLGERETLEELAEQPEALETETSDFSEFIATSSEMPTLTLPSSPIQPANENLERSTSAADSISSSSVKIEGAAPYIARDYGEYFGKSYAQDVYKQKENFRELTRQNIQEKPIIQASPLVRKWEEPGMQQSAEDWGRVEKEIRDYASENIAKKQARKRKFVD